MLVLEQISQTQVPLDHFPIQKRNRLAVILRYQENILLLQNSRYNNITSFPNTGRLLPKEREYSLTEIQEKAKQLILETTGYTDMIYQDRLNLKLLRRFHKPDKDYNEQGIYDRSILIYELNSLKQKEKTDADHTILRVPEKKLQNIFDSDGNNGSSHLIYKGYQEYLKTA